MKCVHVSHDRMRLEGLRLSRCEPNKQYGWWTMVLIDEADSSEHRIRLTEFTVTVGPDRTPSEHAVGDGDLLNIVVKRTHPDVAMAVQIVEMSEQKQ